MGQHDTPEFDVTLQTLNYAARLLVSELDSDLLIERALDTLCDFGESRRTALLTVDDERHCCEVAGEMTRAGLTDPDRELPYLELPLGEVIHGKQPAVFPAQADEPLPLPHTSGEPAETDCLCLPLIGGHNQVIGVATLERPRGEALDDLQLQALNVVTTLVAVSMENARLFRLATVDGLTGLYVRRYFEIRLGEEVARMRRHGGSLAVLMTDIDHFKTFNDTYGHQQGDAVLRELATLVRTTIRTGVDVPCRYGGEEYVVIMPDTDLEGAQHLAERLRQVVERHPFAGQFSPLAVTISGGVAAIDQDHLLTPEKLVKRADEALYVAKEAGRNQIRVWEEP